MKVINLGKVVGDDGKSPYEIWLEQGNTGTEEDFLNSLVGKDGRGILKIEKTNTIGLIDTYTITYTDGTTSTYEVKNGADGTGGGSGITDVGGGLPTFKGKTLLVTGDSITEKNFRADKNWHDFLKEWCGFDEVKNDGKSGSGLVKKTGIVYRIDTWDSKYGDFDMILIMGNMNDGTSNESDTIKTGEPEWYGSFADQSDDKKDTSLYGALHYTCRTLINKYPNKQIGWIISTPRSQVGTQGKCWGIDGWFEKWVTAIKEVCNHYSIPVLDLYNKSGLRPWNATHNKTYFSCNASPSGDGIHPNALGQELMAKKIYAWINQYMDADFSLVSGDVPVIPDEPEEPETIPVTGVEITGSETLIPIGSNITLEAMVKPDNATNKLVNWSSNNSNVTLTPAIETHGATCEIKGVSAGSSIITATTSDGNFTDTYNVTIDNIQIDVESITLNKQTTTLGIGESEQLSVTFNPENATEKSVTWSSNSENATVDEKGLVTAVSEGEVTITATTANGKTATCVITIEKVIDFTDHDIYDTFTRANGDLVGTISDSGHTWTAPGTTGKTEISNGEVKGTVAYNVAYLETESADMKIGAKFKHYQHEVILARVDSNASNYISLQIKESTIELVKKVSGTNTVLATISKTITNKEYYYAELECNGTSIKGYINGELLLQGTYEEDTTTKKAGFMLVQSSNRMDDFYVDYLD